MTEEQKAILNEAISILDLISGTPNDLYVFGEVNSREGSQSAFDAMNLIERVLEIAIIES